MSQPAAAPSAEFSSLPLSREHGTPQWDPAASRTSVSRYFRELERLLVQKNVTVDQERKQAAVMYTPSDVERNWSSLPQFNDAAVTFDDFKKAVLEFYPGLDSNQRWTVAEFNAIVVDAFGRHASTTAEYLDFYRRIFPVARYLLTKATPDVTEREVTKYLVGVVDPSFHPRIMAHLEWKVNKNSNDSYTIEQVHEAIMHSLNMDNPFGVTVGQPALTAGRDLPPHMSLGHSAATPSPSIPPPVISKNAFALHRIGWIVSSPSDCKRW